MLGQRRRRWPNIKPALAQRTVISGVIGQILSYRAVIAYYLTSYRATAHHETKPNKDTLTHCWLNAGPTSNTVAQYKANIGSTSRDWWDHSTFSELHHMMPLPCTVSPRINVHALISEIRMFQAWLQKYSCSLIFEYYMHAFIFGNYYVYRCVTKDIYCMWQ